MLIEQPPRLFRWFYNKAICLLPQKEKTVYLTFDDGPCPETTLHLLEVLDAYGVKAILTFLKRLCDGGIGWGIIP